MHLFFFLGTCGYAFDNTAFVYSLYNIQAHNPLKLNARSGTNALYRCSSYGPIFGGGHDIFISNNAGSNTDSRTYCGISYPLPPGYSLSSSSCKFYAGTTHFTPTDIEVFYETTG